MREGPVMTASRTAAAEIPAARTAPAARIRHSRRAAAAMLGVAALAAAGVLASGGCPGATNTGVPAGTTLKSVPSQVSSGPGWSYSATDNNVTVTGNGTVLSGLSIPCTLVIDASNVTVNDVQVTTSGAFGITLTHTKGVTIENSVISGTNATTGRVDSAIDDVYGDSTGMVIKDNNISLFRTAMQISAGLVQGNYIHNPGYIAGDHTNGIVTNGGTESMTINDNTILNSLGQTDAISLDAAAAGTTVANKTIENNFLAGGGYSIYGGDGPSTNPTSKIVITGNRFGQNYFAKGGQFG